MDYSLLGGHVYDSILIRGVHQTINLYPLFEEVITTFENIINSKILFTNCLGELTPRKIKLVASPFLECLYLFVNKKNIDGYVVPDLLRHIAERCERCIPFLFSRKCIADIDILEAATRTRNNALFEIGLKCGRHIYKSNYILELCCKLDNPYFVNLILEKRRAYAYECILNLTFSPDIVNLQIAKYLKLQTCFEIAQKRKHLEIIECLLKYDNTLGKEKQETQESICEKN